MTVFAAVLAVLSIWDYPSRQVAHERLRDEFVQAVRSGDVVKKKAIAQKGTELLPDDPVWAYNLACAYASANDEAKAFDQLENAIDLGFRNEKAIADDEDWKGLSSKRRFRELVEYARESCARAIVFGPLAVVDAEGVMGESLMLGEQNMMWDFDDGCFIARMKLAPGAGGANAGDLYMNRDGAHSHLAVTNFPGLTEVKLDQVGRARGMDLDFPNIKFPYPVFGNCSRACVQGAFWRSLPRAAMTHEARYMRTMASLYLSNQVWVFPANADYPPVGTNGDVFASVAPYWLVTQGRSWSDQYYLRAALEASRSFTAETKRALVARRLLAPTIMTLIRKSLKGVDGEDAYLTEKAHPTCLPPGGVDLARLARLAQGLCEDSIPPLVRIFRMGAPVKEKSTVPEITYLTPFAAAVILRSPDERRTFELAFNGAETIAVRVVHDPARAAKLFVEKDGCARLMIDRTKMNGTSRVDVAAFGRNNGTAWGAPAYVSFAILDEHADYCDPALLPRTDGK